MRVKTKKKKKTLGKMPDLFMTKKLNKKTQVLTDEH
jgi:hypothetical protein